MDGLNTCLVITIPIVLVSSFFIYFFKYKKKHIGKSDGIMHFLVYVAFAVYLCVLCDSVFFPIPLSEYGIQQAGMIYEGTDIPYYNIVPLKSILEMFSQSSSINSCFYQISGNILLFVPFGFLLMCLYDPKWKWKRILLLSAGTSLFIEMLQLILLLSFGYPFRYADIDDLLLNTLGCIFGVCVYYLLKPILKIVLQPES